MKFRHSFIVPKEQCSEVKGEGGNWRLEYEEGKFLSFIHLPKTGGISIWEWVQNNFPNCNYWKSPHWSHYKMQRQYAEQGMDLGYTFGIIRNPYDWTVSRWAHYLGSRNHTPESLPFETYLELSHVRDSEGLNEEPGKTRYHIEDFEGMLKGVNYIIRYEYLEEEFDWIRNITGCYEKLDKKNVSRYRSNYQSHYTDRCKEIVESCYADTIGKFNYEW